ncbi:oligosaccharide flippase family protein [Pseudomonadota bacterium]
MSRIQQLGKDSIIYGLGGVLAKGASFFLLPIYTRIFTPVDYGTIEMLKLISAFVAAILIMGMDTAQSFYFFKEKSEGKSAQIKVVSAILQWRLVFGSVTVLIATLLAPLLTISFMSAELTWHYFAVAFCGAFFATVMSQSVEIFRLLYRPWPYIWITLLNTLGTAALILLFVLKFDQGIMGYFLGSMISGLLVAGLAWYLVREYVDFSTWHTEWWPKLLKFGAPLLPAGLAFYGMSSADRWFIQYYQGEHVLGLYAIGATFALLVALVVETFRKAWWPIAMDAMHSDDGPETFRIVARLFMGIGAAAVVMLTFMSPWLIKWFTGPAFHSAWPLVGVLAWSSLMYGFYMIASRGIFKVEKTSILAYLMGVAMILNMLLNWLLVPLYSSMGAAVSTVIAYFVWVILSMIISERYWRVGFPVLILSLQVGIGMFYVAWFLIMYESYGVVIQGVSALIVSGVLLFSSIGRHHRSVVFNWIHERWAKQ